MNRAERYKVLNEMEREVERELEWERNGKGENNKWKSIDNLVRERNKIAEYKLLLKKALD